MTYGSENFLYIPGWMQTELKLKGYELLVYAAIYGFSQKDGQWFTGGQQYLAEACGSTIRTVRNTLQRLIDAGLIEESFSEDDARLNIYRTTDVRKIEEKFSANLGEIEEKISANYEMSEEKIEEKSSATTGKIFRNSDDSICIYNNIHNKKNKKIKNTAADTRASARESAASPVDELTDEQIREIVDVWNRQKLTKQIFSIHRLSNRESHTRLCIGIVGYDDFLLTIGRIDQQAFFKKTAEEGNPVRYDWFVKPDTFQKVIEGNYEQEFGKKKTEETFAERLARL